MGKKKKPSADEPIIFGKWLKDIPIATDDAPPQFVLGMEGKQVVKFPVAKIATRVNPKHADITSLRSMPTRASAREGMAP